jgi:hypothetical protein
MAWMTRSRWSVGACTKAAAPATLTTPNLTCAGCSNTKLLAAAWAASMRLGWTSPARMLPELSMASITVSMRLGNNMMACGLAIASSKPAKPDKISSTGKCRVIRLKPTPGAEGALPADGQARCSPRACHAMYKPSHSGKVASSHNKRGQTN